MGQEHFGFGLAFEFRLFQRLGGDRRKHRCLARHGACRRPFAGNDARHVGTVTEFVGESIGVFIRQIRAQRFVHRSLSQGGTTQKQALSDYNVALAEYDRATGAEVISDQTLPESKFVIPGDIFQTTRAPLIQSE